MNRDQWAVFYALCGGWPGVRLLADFKSARQWLVNSSSGRSGIDLPSGVRTPWLDTTSKGLIARDFGQPPTLTVTWTEIRAWVDSQPAQVIAKAKAMQTEWQDICRNRPDLVPGQMGPSWAAKNVYGPKTLAATTSLECDERERLLRAAERDLLTGLGPVDEPTDLLELLAAMA